MRLVRDEPVMEIEPVGDADGPVNDTPEELEGDAESSDSSDSGSLADVDSRLLEALLLSTHHPLTAGRLAELGIARRLERRS